MTTTQLAPRAPTMAMGTLSDPAELGRVLAASGYFTDAREAAQAVVKVLAGAELGFGPIASMTGVFIVKGRVTLGANLMAAAIKQSPKYDYRVRDLSDTKAVVLFLERKGDGWEEAGESEFTMDMARQAGLANGENWKKYPRNMLLWRAMSNGAKFFCPDVFSGAPVYLPDEMGADIDGSTGEIIDAEATNVAPPVAPPRPEPAHDDTGGKPAPAVEVTTPAPTTEEAGPEVEPAPAIPSPGDDPNRQVTEAEVEMLRALLERLKAPEGFWRMALLSYGAADFEALSVGQAHQMMTRANERFGARA